MSDLLTCGPTAATVRAARQFVSAKLKEWGRDDLVDSAVLLTSELVTNAVVHTGRAFTVRVAQDEHCVRVEVADAVHVQPTPPRGRCAGEPVELDSAFRGLSIVDSVASAWGSQPVPGDGKIVWFELVGTSRGLGRRSEISGLSDLPARASRLPLVERGNHATDGHTHQEVRPMARREHVMDRGDVVEEHRRHDYDDDDGGGGIWKWILLALVIVAIAVIAFFALGGDADVDTEGDLEIPEVDVDANAPDVDVDTDEAPPASAEANADSSNGG